MADQLGHSSPMLTLKIYAHAMRDEEVDLSFADFGVTERLYTSPDMEADPDNESAPDATHRGHWRNLEHETGLEPATPTLATFTDRPESLRKAA